MPPKEGSNVSRKRAYHPKSRTGCWSCRNRKVKCDEGKPECQRCQNYGTRCAGYAAVRPIFSTYCSITEQQPYKTILRAPSIPLMSSTLQEQYFKLFCTKTMDAIVPYFGRDDWEREWCNIVINACQSDPALFHAIVAMGALEKTCEDVGLAKNDGLDKNAGILTVNPHHEFALKEYGKALQLLGRNVREGPHDIMIILLTTIFVVCFEQVHGNFESSVAQIQCVLKLIEEWKAKYQVADKHDVCFSSPAPHEVPSCIMQVFGRLEIQTMLFIDTRPAEMHTRLKLSGTEDIKSMPSVFTSAYQARLYLDLIMRRFQHWIWQIGHNPTHTPEEPLKQESLGLQLQSLPTWNSALLPTLDDWETPPSHHLLPKGYQQTPPFINRQQWDVWESIPIYDNRDPMPFHDELYAEQDNYMSELHAWHAAFDPLYTPLPDPKYPDIVGLSLLRLHYLIFSISLQAKLSSQESIYDQYIADFVESLSLCSTILSKLKSVKSSLHFTFDHGVLIPLYLIMTKCRMSTVRREALLLTRAHQRREGNWDSELTAAAGEWVIRIEEEGALEDGSIPERARVSRINLKSQLECRRASINCLRWSENEGRFAVCADTIFW